MNSRHKCVYYIPVSYTHLVVGNTVIDALHLVLEQIGVRKDIEKNIQFVLERVGIPLSLLSLWKSGERKMVLITGHRRENFGEGFIHICKAIKTLAEKYSMVDFVYPMHLNPNVRKPIAEILGESHKETLTNVFLIEPLDYLPFVYLRCV